MPTGPMLIEPPDDRLCQYGDTKPAAANVTKDGNRPTPECAEHVRRSLERWLTS